jgi:hyaluronan synthase
MKTRRFVYIFVAVTLVVAPLILSMYIHLPNIGDNLQIISIYGLFILFYMIIQMIFAYLNRLHINKICEDTLETDNKYNILIVGYREDPELFRKCLVSHKKHIYNPMINKIIVVVDGNSSEDIYMADIFKNVFTFHGKVYNTQYPRDIASKALCILQPHGGKRQVLYTGLEMSVCHGVKGVICTDSDTEMHRDSVENLVKTLESSDKIGAVTGFMTISNKVSIISYMSYIRYWFACNLERAYQSYNGVVLCVSGPIGIYRTDIVARFLNEFVTQSFMGKQCTYGDDRHLTNNILEEGYEVKYNHLATCKTDTPENILRFFNQQTRWCKSSYRELLWTLRHIHKHSFWLTVDILYQTAYSLIVLSSLIYIFTLRNLEVIVSYFMVILVTNFIKGIYASSIEGTTEYILYSLYGYIYISLIIPSKIYAGITLSDTSWGTSSRKFVFDTTNYGHFFMGFWILSLISALIYNVIINEKTNYSIIGLGFIFSYIIISFSCIKYFNLKD